MKRQDQRSVGELLLDADFTTRQLLMDVTGQDAPAMLRTWGEVVQSASELWATLPQPFRGTTSPIDGVTIARLESMSRGMHRDQVRRGWPGDGTPDERLLHVAETLTRAADLIDRRGGHIGPTDPAVRADLDAARMRIMHTLYVGAHSVGVAAGQHVRDVELSTRGKSDRESRAVPRGRDAINRLAAFEQLAGAYVGNQFARAAQGEHVHGPHGTERLQQALIGWDIQAHRTLAATPTAANLLLASRTQAGIATAAAAILHAGASTGHVDAHAYEHRLAPTLDATQQAWTHVATRWAEMTSPSSRTDLDLVHAAGELRAAVREVAHDKTTWARPEVMAGRVDLGEAAEYLQQALSSAVDVAAVIRDVDGAGQGLLEVLGGFAQVDATGHDLGASPGGLVVSDLADGGAQLTCSVDQVQVSAAGGAGHLGPPGGDVSPGLLGGVESRGEAMLVGVRVDVAGAGARLEDRAC